MYEPCDGVIKFHIRPIADQIPSGVQIDAMTSASDCVTHCYSKPNCHQAIYVPGNLDKNETAVCKTGNLTQPTCSESIPVVTEYNDTIPVILECFVCVPFSELGVLYKLISDNVLFFLRSGYGSSKN